MLVICDVSQWVFQKLPVYNLKRVPRGPSQAMQALSQARSRVGGYLRALVS